MAKKYRVISPDGIPVDEGPFPTAEAAWAFVPFWCLLYEDQGFYLTRTQEKIPLDELRHRVTVAEC